MCADGEHRWSPLVIPKGWQDFLVCEDCSVVMEIHEARNAAKRAAEEKKGVGAAGVDG